jgi:hypothetical protein
MEEKQTIRKCPRCGYSPSGKERSGNQNRYYWGVIIELLHEYNGDEKDKWHNRLKNQFLKEIHFVKGKEGKIIEMQEDKSTTELDTKEFEEFLSQIRIWASSELGVWIPEPHEELHEQVDDWNV